MLKRHSEVFRSSLLVADLALVAASWLLAYALRFHTVFPVPLGVPELRAYVEALVVILPLWLVLFRSRRLYEPRRTSSVLRETTAVVSATAVGVLCLVAITFFARGYYFSRGVMALFFGLASVSVAGFRLLGRLSLRAVRRRGFNLRYVLIVGAGRVAEEVLHRIDAHPETGLFVRGLLAESPSTRGRSVRGTPVLGTYDALQEVLRDDRIDQVILALPREESHRLEKLLALLEDETVTVRLVPDLMHVSTLRSSVEDFDGLAMINLRETPLVGWAAVAKRGLDLLLSLAGLIVAAPLMAVIAGASLATSGRPILFAQRRMGLDGSVFRMLKFRTMVPAADDASDLVWTRRDDPRCTRLGAFLRRTSLDELPQLWNVLRGDMSLVGPRPERPALIERFRREIPGYMLRHKVRAGLTGWAQVCGWRGDTSLHERIEHDIYYIQNWSLRLDLRILVLTLWRGWMHRNAY